MCVNKFGLTPFNLATVQWHTGVMRPDFTLYTLYYTAYKHCMKAEK